MSEPISFSMSGILLGEVIMKFAYDRKFNFIHFSTTLHKYFFRAGRRIHKNKRPATFPTLNALYQQ
jgi:hypothetical protein